MLFTSTAKASKTLLPPFYNTVGVFLSWAYVFTPTYPDSRQPNIALSITHL